MKSFELVQNRCQENIFYNRRFEKSFLFLLDHALITQLINFKKCDLPNYHEPGTVLGSKKRAKIKTYWSPVLRSWSSLSREHSRETHKVRKVYPRPMVCNAGQDLAWVSWEYSSKLELQTSNYPLERLRKIFISKGLSPSLPPHTQRHGVNNMEGNQLLIGHSFNPSIVFKDTLDKINIFSTICVKFL